MNIKIYVIYRGNCYDQLFLAFNKINDKRCFSRYGSYSSLLAAQLACTVDPNCQAVVDDGCNDSGDYELCSQTAKFYDGSNYCVYTKGK